MAEDVDYMAVASMTDGMVGAELANIIEVAAINMMRDGRTEVLATCEYCSFCSFFSITKSRMHMILLDINIKTSASPMHIIHWFLIHLIYSVWRCFTWSSDHCLCAVPRHD